MKDYYSIIKTPVVTEKSATQASVGNKVVFWVDKNAKKPEIKEAVEKVFNVKVASVQTARIPGKIKKMGKFVGKTSVKKKAYITLKEGESIEEIFSGVQA